MLLSAYNDPDANAAIPRTLSQRERDLTDHVDRLKHFLATAPSRWHGAQSPESQQPNHHPALNRFLLPSGEYVSCILWHGLYHITGTDIVRALVFRFEAFGRPVRNLKKFEEGVFSDLRNLKPGQDASLEEPKSPFLDLLFKYQCIRTQKKQKVFYWFSVPHDRLFLDALERDLKRERAGLEATTVVVGEPAASFWYDPKRSLHEQFSQVPGHVNANTLNDSTTATQGSGADPSTNSASVDIKPLAHAAGDDCPVLIGRKRSLDEADGLISPSESADPMPRHSNPVLSSFSLFGGSANYKRRRGKIARLPGSISPIGHIPSGLIPEQPITDLPSLGELVPVDMVTESVQTVPIVEQDLFDDSQTSLARAAPCAALPYSFEDSSSLHADAMSRAAREMAYGVPAAPGGKAFTCPLFSCGRLFKRMEHLKRHLRTHTMERPYECQLCHKRFSRSDNLNQHLRTHSRSSGGSAAELSLPAPSPEEQNYSAGQDHIMLSVEPASQLHHESPASSPEAHWLGPPIVTQSMYAGSLLTPESSLSTPSPTTTGPPVTPSPLQHFRSAPGSPGRPLSAPGVYEHRAASEPYRHSWPGPDALPAEYAQVQHVPMKQEYVQAYTFGSAGSSPMGSAHSPMSSFGSVAASPPEMDPYGTTYTEQYAYVSQPQPQACYPMDMPLAVAAPELAFTFA